jgi:ribonuclease HI
MAMLARQGWRMLTNPESLCARVLKARYFPNTSVLEATPAAGISYSWRSILKGIALLKEGITWRIGDGLSVNIWTDAWLARDGTRQPVTPRGQCILTKVSELIEPHSGQWDEELIRDTFWEIDARVILSTPIRDDFEDFPAWHFDSRGLFSVKSAYRVYVRGRDANIASSSLSSDGKSFWTKIWEIPCIPKVKQFMWRLAHNSLPIMANIEKRGIECDTKCTCCNYPVEDGVHLFLKCKEMRTLWRDIGLEDLCDQMATYDSAQDVVQEILKRNDGEKTLIACMLWRWWLRRNKRSKEGKVILVQEILRQSKYWAAESLQIFKKEEKVTTSSRQICRWQRPSVGTMKVNTDGAFIEGTGQGGWGFIVQDDTGAVRGSGMGHIKYAASALHSEAMACLKAVQAVATWGMGNIHIESNSVTLVQALQSSEHDRAPEGVLFREIRILLRLNFISAKVSHARRLCNKAAHCLAALGVNQTETRLVLLEFVPDDVSDVVASELAEPV